MLNLGVPKLDKLLTGVKESSNVLVLGPPGPEKLSLGVHFIGEGFEAKQPCIYATSDVAPAEIEERAAETFHAENELSVARPSIESIISAASRLRPASMSHVPRASFATGFFAR